jgi:peptidoglycan/LPS O-acetylase OafA/YrhL
MTLSDYARGKDNNFNLVRMIAALAVLITHAFSLAIGSEKAEPTFALLGGMSPGAIAVDVFFITSGFLVTTSLLARHNVIDFMIARALRILPALLLVLLLSVLVLGPYFTSLPIDAYIFNSATYSYLLQCSTLFFKIAYPLPGVFETNPYPNVVNGSLWSMKHEVRLYALLALAWAMASFSKKNKLLSFRALLVGVAVVLTGLLLTQVIAQRPVSAEFKLFCLFFSGAVYSVLRAKIPVSGAGFWTLVVALLICGTIYKQLFYSAYIIFVPYLLFYAAYVPSGRIRWYNSIGDYSYGMYIYAFPVQQSVAALVPGVAPIDMILISLPITLAFAVLSWHLVEQRALKLKDYFSGKAHELLRSQTHHRIG